ncbi:AfsR/SARP family transcriptional regulator [Actinomadura sp. 9N407]|uniref:AfsR/SARP family transcriptional regulator n=1 Tax=Actinomadura sp. 9N407 TaxID=3375154 RepID=UPI0037BBC87F
MGFFILGPLAVLHGDRDITPTAPKVRQVLTFLLLRRNQMVQVSEFVDELWADNPPDSAMTTLQTYIYKLRKDVLDPSGLASLHTQQSGYLLEVRDENLDVCAFERLISAGRHALKEGDPESATDLLSRALTLWRGKALVGVTTGEILSAHVTRLEENQLRALEMRIEADMRLGRHQELISELKQLIFTYPLHEGFHGDLMTALNHSGRRYEALEVYRRLRTTLINELGLEPSTPLQRLHQGLLSADRPATDDQGLPSVEAAGSMPRGSAKTASERDEGYDADARDNAEAVDSGTISPPVGPRRVSGGPNSAGAAREGLRAYSETLVLPAQIPPDIADFIGHAEPLHRARQGLVPGDDDADTLRTTARAVSICGMTGVGKTTLALHAAHMEKSRYPDGQLFANLHGGSHALARTTDVLNDFLRAVGIPAREIPPTLEERSKLFRTWTNNRRVLIVLDDAGSASQVAALFPATPRCAVIITSRWGLQGLPGIEALELGTMSTAECLELLSRMIGADRTTAEPQSAQAIVEHCGHLPLAIRSVGARLASMRTWSLQKMVKLLESDPAPLDQFRYAEYDVRARYDCSYNVLDFRDRSTFRLLSLLPPQNFTATTAAGLLGAPIHAVETQLNRLVGHHLLQTAVHNNSNDTHYRLHRLTRLYAHERLTCEYLAPTPLTT